MKKSVVLLFFSFVFVFFCLTLNVYANSDYVIFMDSNFIRKGPSTNYDKLGLENVGSVYNLLDSPKFDSYIFWKIHFCLGIIWVFFCQVLLIFMLYIVAHCDIINIESR